jgi:MazG family protein
MSFSQPQPVAATSPDRRQPASTDALQELLDVVAQLRHPETGCPWDLKQTHHSLRPYMLEEAYEAVDAMSQLPPQLGRSVSLVKKEPTAPLDAEVEGKPLTDPEVDPASLQKVETSLKDELGDVLLQVVLHSQLASERAAFDFESVCRHLSEKLIRRHPHVFARHEGAAELSQASAVVQQWAEIKQAEKAERGESEAFKSILAGISRGQPALNRALETSQRAVKVGFAWPNLDALWECVMSEYDEFRAELPEGAQNADTLDAATQSRLESEFGDILFATVNLARQFKIDPEIALSNATGKFTERFQAMERQIAIQAEAMQETSDTVMAKLDFQTWDELWKAAKAQVQKC